MANELMTTLREVLGDQVISQQLQQLPQLHPCDFYLCSMLDDKVYIKSPHT
jgi:hypothetical protein